jgi:outer membrane receptor protein involved in Fe transport
LINIKYVSFGTGHHHFWLQRIINYDIELRPTTFGARQNVFSTYFEDLISVNTKLNVTLGLRYDYDNLSKAGGTKGDLNNLGLRVAYNYKIDAQDRI